MKVTKDGSMVARSKATPEQLAKHRFNKRSNSTRRIASLKVLEFRHAALKLKIGELAAEQLVGRALD